MYLYLSAACLRSLPASNMHTHFTCQQNAYVRLPASSMHTYHILPASSMPPYFTCQQHAYLLYHYYYYYFITPAACLRTLPASSMPT